MLKLIDLIKLSGIELHHYKIHCAHETGGSSPLEAFYNNCFTKWQEEQAKQSFQCDEIVSLIKIGYDKWLFAGVFIVKGCHKKKDISRELYIYETEEIGGLTHLVGKAIIHWDKKFRAHSLIGKTWEKDLKIHEIRNQRMAIRDFTGYNNVSLKFNELCIIVNLEIPSWKSPLSHIFGIYLITDLKTGKLYVGSAYGDKGIWQRWSEYTSNPHGGNKRLELIIANKGKEYAQNFQFSLLEVCNPNSSDDYVIQREQYWKSVLGSQEFGYNDN